MIAGDKQFTYRLHTKMKGKTKIYELPVTSAKNLFRSDRAFVGFTGDTGSIGRALGWLHTPEGKPPKVELDMLVLTAEGHIYHATTLRNWLKIEEPFFAVGSGQSFALAAMAAGKDPYEAVKIASKYDLYTGMGFNKLTL